LIYLAGITQAIVTGLLDHEALFQWAARQAMLDAVEID